MGAPRHHVRSRRWDDPEVWLGVQEASDMLGVSTATLRRWSAAGKVRAFTTPGGHRRFAESTIRHLLGGAVEREPSALGLGESSDRIAARFRTHLATMGAGMPWLTSVPTERFGRSCRTQRPHWSTGSWATSKDTRPGTPRRRSGRRSTRPRCTGASPHPTAVISVRRSRRSTASGGCSLNDLAGLACRQGLPTADATRLLARADDGVDRLTVALVEAYAGAA